MRILAVADKESSTLVNWIELAEPNLKLLDLIVSCGDLSKDYLEYLACALGIDIVRVRGNHDQAQFSKGEEGKDPHRFFEGPAYEERFEGIKDIHGRLFFFGNWVIVGFEGSLWYNGEGPQHTENEMRRIVRQVAGKLRLTRFADWFSRASRKMMVISHAPPFGIHDGLDLCHRGFDCFHQLLSSFSPALWIHGHTATASLAQNQVSKSINTTVLNAYEYKFIRLQNGAEPLISFKPDILGPSSLIKS